MPNNNSLTRQLTETISIELIPANNSSELEGRIWAINWFDHKRKWLYNLYNKLASKYVVQVGGELHFKGHHQKTLLGKEEHKRQTLLIVTYPQASSFLSMLVIKAFQVVSLLRVKAVANFVFGFTKRVDPYETTHTPKLVSGNNHLVFHYQGDTQSKALIKLAKKLFLGVYFVGERLAQIKRAEKGKPAVLAPFFMDGIAIFESVDIDLLISFTNSDEFTALTKENTSNYAAIFTRIK